MIVLRDKNVKFEVGEFKIFLWSLSVCLRFLEGGEMFFKKGGKKL